MRQPKSIQIFALDQIDIAPELKAVQDLMPMDNQDRENLKADILKNGQRDPIKGYFDNQTGIFLVLAGWTRTEILREIGQTQALIEIIDIPKKERTDLAIGDNLNRRQLSNDQKIILFARLYPEYYNKPINHGGDRKKAGSSETASLDQIAEKAGKTKRQIINDKKTFQAAKEINPQPTPADIAKARKQANEKRKAKPKPAEPRKTQSQKPKNTIAGLISKWLQIEAKTQSTAEKNLIKQFLRDLGKI